MRSALRAMARLVLAPAAVGAAVMTVAYLYSMEGPLVPADELLLGRSAQEISSFVAVRFAREIREIGVGLGVTSLGVGIALGLGASVVAAVRRAARQRRRPRRRSLALRLLGLVALVGAIELFALLASMARWPQLYSRAFYAKGGALASLQTFVTDGLGPRGVAVAAVVTLVGVILGAPRAWRDRMKRLGRASRRPAARVGVLGVVALVAYGLVAGGPETVVARAQHPPRPRRKDGARRPNVLVIASDGLRDDRLRAELAPRLTSIADRGSRFDKAYVTVPRTLSSWTTMLTGLHAHHHGIRSAFPRWADVSVARDTLPSRLRSAGYVTAAVSDYAGDVFRKTDYGFSVTRTPKWDFAGLLWQRGIQRATPLLPFLQTRVGRALLPEMEDIPSAADPRFVADDAIDVLRGAGDQPFFLLVFFSTTHFPYAAPTPYYERFTDPAYAGPFRYEKQVGAGVALIPDDDDVKQIRGLYDGAVAAVDDASSRILDELGRLGLADDTIVVVTADHGETLFEHKRWHGHGDHLFGDEAVHIPLAIYDPRTPVAHREGAVVSSVDFAPTLYELTGIEAPKGLDGRSLAPAVRGAAIPSRVAFCETELWMGWNPGLPQDLQVPPPPLFKLLEVDTDHGTMVSVRPEAAGINLYGRHRMARDGRFKLLYMPTPKGGVEWRLFDTATDKDELVDVKDAHPEVVSRLREALFEWMLGDASMMRMGDRIVLRPPTGSAP